MAFNFHNGLKAAVRDIEVRPVRLPWPYTVLEGDGVPMPPGTECVIELDVPRIEREEWSAALDGASIAPIEKRVSTGSMAGLLAASSKMDGANREKAAAAYLAKEQTREEDLARRELAASTTAPILLRADCDRLCANGEAPPTILKAIKSGRLVAITRRETERLKLFSNPAIPDSIRDSVPLTQDEMQAREDIEPWKLDAESLASVFQSDTGRALPSSVDLFKAPAEPAHVAILRFLIRAASDHSSYEERLGEKKSSPDGGGDGEKPPSARRPRTRRKPSKGKPRR